MKLLITAFASIFFSGLLTAQNFELSVLSDKFVPLNGLRVDFESIDTSFSKQTINFGKVTIDDLALGIYTITVYNPNLGEHKVFKDVAIIHKSTLRLSATFKLPPEVPIRELHEIPHDYYMESEIKYPVHKPQ